MSNAEPFRFPTERLQGAIDTAIASSRRGVVAALGYQCFRLALELHSQWKNIVTEARINNDMMNVIEGGRGYKRTKRQTIERRAEKEDHEQFLAGGYGRLTGRIARRRRREKLGALKAYAIATQDPRLTRQHAGTYALAYKLKSGRYRTNLKLGHAAYAAMYFAAELAWRVKHIGYQASGWLPGVWKFSNRANAGTRVVKVRQGNESSADASGRKTVAKSAPGRVLERWFGVHRYEVALVNFANGIQETESRYSIVNKVIETRRADIMEHVKESAQAGLKEVA